jgi:sucrose-6-phosphate hydrolase SacC (GH32 family)
MNHIPFAQLASRIDGELHTGSTLRRLYATDASEYQELPAGVVLPESENDIREVIRFARRNQLGLIPRAAGTSLAGQCVGSGLVVDISKYFTRILSVDTETRQVRVQPGVVRDVNAKDGYWVMVLFERKGHTIYTSPDLKAWEKTGTINGFHECPELFPLAVDPASSKDYAGTSGEPENVKWIMYGAKGRYHIGAFDGKTFKPETKKQIAMYYGDKCYASQTFNNTEKGPDGQPRRIQTMWQGGRFGQISLPVELTLKTTLLGRRVCMLPAKEIKNLYQRTETLDGLVLEPGAANPLEKMKGGLYDIELEVDLSQASQLILNIRGKRLIVDVSKDGLTLRREMKIPGTKKLVLRVVVDHSSQDVYFGEHGLFYSPRMAKPSALTDSESPGLSPITM